MKRRLIATGAALALALAFSAWLNQPELAAEDIAPATGASATLEQVRAGEYLTRAGNCGACHSAPGGAPFAGGRRIATPFGDVYSSNLTPDDETGLGRWSEADFYRALHLGQSRDGRLLSPAFPYTSTTKISRADSDAIFAWLRTLPPVAQVPPPSTLEFPYDSALALRVWRALNFRPAKAADIAAMDRGAYLVEALGHCGECHTPRGRLGGLRTASRLMGGPIASLGWDALPIAGPDPAESADRGDAERAALLKTGVSRRGAVSGPMSEVVFHSLQYLRDDDIAAITAYLRAQPLAAPPPAPRVPQVSAETAKAQRREGATIYREHCESCHGGEGQGRPSIYPALAGSRIVNAVSATNALRLTLAGGFPPSTEGNPQPYGMPPFSHQLKREQIAAVLTYIRSAWGNDAPPVSVIEVERQ